MTWWPETAGDVDKPRANEYKYVCEVLNYGWHNTSSPAFNMRLERACADFDANGGKALYLATGNPTAKRIYQRAG